MDIIQVLRDEHEHVMNLFEKFDALSEPSAKRPVAEELLQQLMIHEKAEEDAVYGKVRDLLPDPSIVDTALLEQADIKDQIREIVSETDFETIAARLMQLRERVLDHVATEQSEIFPVLRQVLNERWCEQLASDFKTAKAEHMVEFPSLSITMAPGMRVEEERRH
ncbi:DNA nickase [compost metagenome]